MTPEPYSADAGLGAKLRRRYARLVHRRPARLDLGRPTVSFTFDDAPASAATAAAILERHEARGTYYLCAGLFDETGHMGRYINATEAADLAARGHEIGRRRPRRGWRSVTGRCAGSMPDWCARART